MNIFEMIEHRWDTLWMEPRTMYDILPVVVLFILIGGMAGPASAITIEYFQSPPTHTGFTRITDTYTNTTDLMQAVMAEADGTWSSLSDIDKAWNILTFTRKHLTVSQTSDVAGPSHLIDNTTIYTHFNNMSSDTSGYMCGGTAELFLFLANAFGFETYHISAGKNAPASPEWTHAFCLVRLNVDGHYKMVLHDPYFGDVYTYTNGTPMSFFVMQDLIAADQFDQINRRSIGQSYDTWAITLTGYDMYGTWSGSGLDYKKQVGPYIQHTYLGLSNGKKLYRVNNWFLYQYCLITEPQWTTHYTTPYDLFNDVFDTMDVNRNDPGIAYIEGRET